MQALRRIALVVFLLVSLPLAAATDPASTRPLAPFRIADNLFYVGSEDLAAFLITTPAGDILINENLPSSPPQILHSIEQLGQRPADIKILLCSHAHIDHIGGAAALRRATHAQLALMDADVAAASSGGRRDPTFPGSHYPAVPVDRVLHDGDAVSLGGTTVVAHKTAGHTPGTTTFTFTTTLAGKPERVVLVGSWNLLDNYRLVATARHPATYPGIAAAFERSFKILSALPCDLFLAAHGSMFHLLDKLAQSRSNPSIWIDPAGYQAALSAARARFEQALQQQTRASTR